jgi:hypothetical protein
MGEAEETGALHGDVSEAFSSNAVRLSAAEWALAASLVIAALLLVPWIVQRKEAFSPSIDYRHPYLYSEDYWLYARYSRYAAARYAVAIIGDSVVWGHYVEPQGTLSHFLNQEAGRPLFANLGLDGTRPMALAGLVRYYAKDIAGQGVILHLNPLWMSSPGADLHPARGGASGRRWFAAQVERFLSGVPPAAAEDSRINHPALIPQLRSRPYGYHPSLGEMVGIGLERHVPYDAWVRHMRMVYFENLGMQSWTMGNPYRNPLKAVTFELPPPEDRPGGNPVPWSQGGVEQQNFPWWPLKESYQWERFRAALATLRARHNDVFVVIGPLNTHLMTERSAERYDRLRGELEAWLRARGVPCCAPKVLPSDLYADASHPLKAGYAQVAEELFADEAFRDWIRQVAGGENETGAG